MKRFTLIFIMSLLSSYSHAKLLARTSPLSWLLGAANTEVMYGFDDSKWAVGLGGTSWSAELFDLEFSMNELRIRGDYFFNKTFEQGWYLSAMYSRLTFSVTTEESGVEFKGSVTGNGLLAYGGYHWQWDHFHMELGAGFGAYSFGSKIELESVGGDLTEKPLPAVSAFGLEYNLGWVF